MPFFRGFPMLESMVLRMRCLGARKITVLTSSETKDAPIIELARYLGTGLILGAEKDVHSRFLVAAKQSPEDYFVRVTGDNPFFDPRIALSELREKADSKFDYLSTKLGKGFPVGVDTEICRRQSFIGFQGELTEHNRENVTSVFYQNPDTFDMSAISRTVDSLSRQRLTIDTPEDYLKMKTLVNKLGDRYLRCTWEELVSDLPSTLSSKKS